MFLAKLFYCTTIILQESDKRNLAVNTRTVSQGLVQGYNLPFQQNERRGLLVTVPPMAANSPSAVRKAREASLQVKGARLFNLIPRDLRDKKNVTVDTFKSGLDEWLSTIPDQPTSPGRQRAAITNSLIDQVVANS